jgi:hypothetical protein
MNLKMFFDFIQALIIKQKHSTKNEHFSKHIPFTTIYLLQKQKWNHNKESEQEINMKCFPKSNENDFHMYAKLQDLMFHECL